MIELMLAMAFVATLLASIAIMVIQIANIYTRGITLKEVNQAGRSIVSELQRNISASTPFHIDPDSGNKYNKDKINIFSYYIKQKGADGKVGGGRLCLAKYSYVWNFGKNINNNDIINKYSTAVDKNIYFVKIYDPNAEYCEQQADNSYLDIVSDSKAVELLNKGDSNLAIQNMSITTDTLTATDAITGQQLYDVEFVLGTNNQVALNYDPTETKCKLPDDIESDPLYCSINKFHIVLRAGNTFK